MRSCCMQDLLLHLSPDPYTRCRKDRAKGRCWSRRRPADVPRQLDTTDDGPGGGGDALERAEVAAGLELLVRRQPERRELRRHEVGRDILAQVGSPLGAQVAHEIKWETVSKIVDRHVPLASGVIARSFGQ